MSKKKETEEFKPNVIEPIEGQMCYDELLVPEKEEKEEVKDTSTAQGQLDIWGMSKAPSSARKSTVMAATEEDVEVTEIAQEQSEAEGGDGSGNGASNGGNVGGSGVLFKPLEEVLHDSMIPYTESVLFPGL